MTDITIIERLNAQLYRPIKQVKKISWITKGFVLNAQGQVTHLSIFKARLNDHIPPELFEFKHLEYLDIRENGLTTLPEDIAHLNRLNYADFRNNRLQNLPESFAALQQLQKLYLGQNALTLLPDVLAKLQALELIDFSNNEISKGCERLLQSESIRNIYLNNNELHYFPFESLRENQLDELVLIDNPLKTKPNNITNKVQHLLA